MINSKSYQSNISNTVSFIKVRNFLSAKEYIKKVLMEDYHAPEPQNLIGIIAELSGNYILACKHYRAANALDPTYKPAIRNLERVTSFNYIIEQEEPDYGISLQNSEPSKPDKLKSA